MDMSYDDASSRRSQIKLNELGDDIQRDEDQDMSDSRLDQSAIDMQMNKN